MKQYLACVESDVMYEPGARDPANKIGVYAVSLSDRYVWAVIPDIDNLSENWYPVEMIGEWIEE